MLEKNKKRFKLNIVDFVVIFVILTLIFAAFVKFKKYNVKTEDSVQKNILYDVLIYGVREYTANAYQIGDMVFDSLTGLNIGSVKNIEVTDAVSYETSEKGELVKVINPYKKDVVLTIETEGTVESDAYYANKSIELKVNSQKEIETKYAKTYGTISNINVVD